MQWIDAISEQINKLSKPKITTAVMERIAHSIDMTSLNEDDTEQTIAAMLQQVTTLYGPVAAVCVAPRFVRMAAFELRQTSIKVATVANFPGGHQTLEEVLTEISKHPCF